MRAAIPAIAAVAIGQSAWAVDDYDACVALIETDAPSAIREAGDWARYGGGAAARHCYALALIATGAEMRAADELIGIAQEEPELSDAARADILVQAGQLLVDDGSTLTAMLVAQQAVQLSKGAPSALALRAEVQLAEGRPREALEDLNDVMRTRRPNSRVLLLRAVAYRQMGNGVAARDDAAYALELDETQPKAWLERGRADAMLGDKPAARKALLRAIELDRDGPVGRAAQLSLQRLEAGLSQ